MSAPNVPPSSFDSDAETFALAATPRYVDHDRLEGRRDDPCEGEV